MIQSFKDSTSQDIYDGRNSKAARRIPQQLHDLARKKFDMLNAAKTPLDLRSPPGNRLESLKGNLVGFYSIRLSDQWRIIFEWTPYGPQNVYIDDYH